MLLLSLGYWWLKESSDSVLNGDINWSDTQMEKYNGDNVTISIIADGINISNQNWKDRAKKNLFYNMFDVTKTDKVIFDLNENFVGTSAAMLSLGSKNDNCNSMGVASGANLGSFVMYNISVTENPQDVVCYAYDLWDIAILLWKQIDCDDYGCVYVERTLSDESILDDCLYNASTSIPKLFVVPAGGENLFDASYSPPVRWPLVFSIVGVNRRGSSIDKETEGTSIFMSCPISDYSGYINSIHDNGECGSFSSTNESASIFAGGLAVLLSSAKNMSKSVNITDIFYITAFTADRICSNSFHWRKNGIGLYFNRRFGFGRLNLGKAVELLESWDSVGGFGSVSDFVSLINYVSIDNNNFSFLIDSSDHKAALHVNIRIFNKDFPICSMCISLTSPMGTVSYIKLPTWDTPRNSVNILDFPSYEFLGETINGNWSLKFHFLDGDTIGFIEKIKLTIFYSENAPDRSLISQNTGSSCDSAFNNSGSILSFRDQKIELVAGTQSSLKCLEILDVDTAKEIEQSLKYYISYYDNASLLSGRVPIDAAIDIDSESINFYYIPTAFYADNNQNTKNYKIQIEYINSTDVEKSFTVESDLIDMKNFYSPSIIKPAENAEYSISQLRDDIDQGLFEIVWVTGLGDFVFDGSSTNVAISIISTVSNKVISRRIVPNIGKYIWTGSIEINMSFLLTVSPISGLEVFRFSRLERPITILPDEGEEVTGPSFAATLVAWIVVIFLILFLYIIIRVVSYVKYVRYKKSMEYNNPLIPQNKHSSTL